MYRALPSGRRRASRLAAALAALLLPALVAVAAADWPQWRGPGGLGVVADAPLPTRWGPESANLRWATPIPGEGHSSPIVSGGRVFLTTAYEGSRGGIVDRALTGALAALALWLAIGIGREWRRDRRALRLVSLLFLLGAVLITVWPELFYAANRPGRVWRATGTLGLVGLAAAVGWLPRRSRLRLAGIAALAVAAVFVAWLVPPSQVGPAPLSKRLLVVLPALAGLAIYLRGYLGRRARTASGPEQGGVLRAAVPLSLLALLVFLPPNYLRGEVRALLALDLSSGEVLWQKAALAARPEQKYARASYANPTPATDGERIYAYYGAGLAAFDTDGGLDWLRRFPEYSRYSRYGAATSPVLAGEAVIVVQEKEAYQGGPPGWIAAFDRRSGKTLWRVTPEGARDSYNTPLVVGQGDDSILLTASWGFLAAYDVGTGEELWRLEYPMMQVVASMAASGDLIAVSGGAHGDRELLVARLDGDRRSPPEPLWTSSSAVARVPSPVFAEGRLWTLTDGGVLTAYAAEGDRIWRRRLDGDYFASLLAGDGKLYAVNTLGATSVIATTGEPELLAVNELGEEIYATPAAAGGCLLLRTVERLYCFEADAPTSTEEGDAP